MKKTKQNKNVNVMRKFRTYQSESDVHFCGHGKSATTVEPVNTADNLKLMLNAETLGFIRIITPLYYGDCYFRCFST